MSDVTKKHWQQVKEIFEGALEREGSEREAFLDRACTGDVALRQEVDSLLRSYGQAGSFMEAPAVALAAESLMGEQKKLAVGQVVKHYQVLGSIGEGGMGEVYLAKDTILGRRVALKVLPEFVGANPDRLRRFKQEARSASTLNHPNVCVIHEIGETEDGRPFIAMENIEGVTLRQRLNDREMKLGDALDIAIQVADALTAAHEASIVHRDIKPENIMIRRDGYVKVFDFGLAKLTEQRRQPEGATKSTLLVNSSPGTVMGTAAYMSPEQARGVAVDERTDIWSLGVVLYEMVSGQAPFTGQTPTDVVIAIVEKDPPTLSQHLPDVPAELERIVRKALRKDADQRYQIVKEMAIDLRSLRKDLELDSQLERSLAPSLAAGARTISGAPIGAATGTDKALDTGQLRALRVTTVGTHATSRSNWPLRLGMAALILALVGVGSFAVYKLTRPEPPPQHFQKIAVTKLTTNGNALFAAISPDGKYVSYVKSESGRQSLWLRQVGSAGNLEIVPAREGQYLGVAFSPDGGSLYYGYSDTNSNDSAEIFRVPVLGTGAPPVKVNPDEGPSSMSHDGKRLAFLRHSRADQSDTLVVANADGSNEQPIATRKWPERFVWDWSTSPAWTNDDQSLNLPTVNSDANGFFMSIYEIHLTDRVEKIINLASQRFEQPNQVNLLSDTSALILSARAQGASFEQIWYLGRDGSVRSLTNDLSDYRTVLLSADSKSLVTTQVQTLANIWIAPKSDSTQATQVTSGLGRYFDISCAPDGMIVYASDASGSADIYEIAANGGNLHQLTSNMKRNYAPQVSPDNRFIVFHSNRAGVFQVWRMDRDGSNPVQLTFGNSESHWPQFSADGRSVIYQHFEPGVTTTLWRIPIEGGTPAKVTEGFAVRPAVSPDGKRLGFWYNDGQPNSRWKVGYISFENVSLVKTYEVGPTVQVNWDALVRWSADGRSLTYVNNHAGVENVWGQPIDSGPAKQLTNFTESRILSFDWTREGSLVASRGVVTSDVVLITDVER